MFECVYAFVFRGNADYGIYDGDIWATDKWIYSYLVEKGSSSTLANWYYQLLSDKNFKKTTAWRWKQLRQNGAELSTSSVITIIDTIKAEITVNAANRNFNKFSILTVNLWPNPYEMYAESQYSSSWENQVEYLKDWLMDDNDGRFKYMDDQMEEWYNINDAIILDTIWRDKDWCKPTMLNKEAVISLEVSVIGNIILEGSNFYTNQHLVLIDGNNPSLTCSKNSVPTTGAPDISSIVPSTPGVSPSQRNTATFSGITVHTPGLYKICLLDSHSDIQAGYLSVYEVSKLDQFLVYDTITSGQIKVQGTELSETIRIKLISGTDSNCILGSTPVYINPNIETTAGFLNADKTRVTFTVAIPDIGLYTICVAYNGIDGNAFSLNAGNLMVSEVQQNLEEEVIIGESRDLRISGQNMATNWKVYLTESMTCSPNAEITSDIGGSAILSVIPIMNTEKTEVSFFLSSRLSLLYIFGIN